MNRRQALLGGAAAASCAQDGGAEAPARASIRRGVNLGNGLEAPAEGQWGYRVEIAHLDAIAGAGFDGVRLPVRWDTHMGASEPFMVDPAFFERIDEVVGAALARSLKVQLDVHHYAALYETPDTELPRYGALWRQIAERYKDLPDALIFEPLNEPRGPVWTGARVTQSQVVALDAIRPSNPTRLVVLGGPDWNSVRGLAGWTPPADAHVMATAHYYEPHAFTHQGAGWENPPPRYDRDWGTSADVAHVRTDIETAARWGREHGLAMQIGEFGVIGGVSLAQRVLWTRIVREACEEAGCGWCVWDFGGAFPIWDAGAGRLAPELVDALLG